CYYYIDEVSVTEFSVHLEMPTAFTPNGDNRNEVYTPVLQSGVSIETFRIYNCWGQKVYDGNTGWDGTYRGEPQPTNVYAYYIEIKSPNGNTEKKAGSFTLLR
ncbi:MAG: T9SS type B sorting domain-containing protein, partial [Hyphomonadaceae bacterium]